MNIYENVIDPYVINLLDGSFPPQSAFSKEYFATKAMLEIWLEYMITRRENKEAEYRRMVNTSRYENQRCFLRFCEEQYEASMIENAVNNFLAGDLDAEYIYWSLGVPCASVKLEGKEVIKDYKYLDSVRRKAIAGFEKAELYTYIVTTADGKKYRSVVFDSIEKPYKVLFGIIVSVKPDTVLFKTLKEDTYHPMLGYMTYQLNDEDNIDEKYTSIEYALTSMFRDITFEFPWT